MAQQIIIKRAYFDNIKLTIDAINEFFSSQFKTKNFPSIESDTDVDVVIGNIVELLNHVEPSWVDNPDKVDAAVESINESLEENEVQSIEDSPIYDRIYAYIGYKVLQFISDNFDGFSSLLNGIYTFDMFIDPAKYQTVIEKFSLPINLSEITHPLPNNDDIHLFSIEAYVNGIFSNKEYINTGSLAKEDEITRMHDYRRLDKAEIIVDDRSDEESVEESYHMEQSTINFFLEDKPKHIKYDSAKDKFIISQQLKNCINSVVSAIEKCDSTDDLKRLFLNEEEFKNDTKVVMLANNVSPFILNKVFNNPRKFCVDGKEIENLQNFIKSYDSIKEKNKGAQRYFNYDIFSTFKVDKEGTIRFLRDFMTCELYNNQESAITNNTLMTLFNIFDSRIYYDRLYNLIPDGTKKSKYPSEDAFVKKARARLNKTSHSANVYNEKPDTTETIKDDKQVQEFVYKTMRQLGDCSLTDMSNVEMYSEMVNAEISNIGNMMYNNGISLVAMNHIIQEMEMGDIPDYMKERLDISDKKADDITVSPADDIGLPPDNQDPDPNADADAPVPENSFDDLATSIDNKINSFDGQGRNVDGMLGSGYEARKEPSDGKVVYNVTNNYNYQNSFNKNSGNTMNDSSQGKTVNISNKDSNNDSSVTTVHGGQPTTPKVPEIEKPAEPEIPNIPEPEQPKNDNNENVENKETPQNDDNNALTNNSNNNNEHVDDTIASTDISDTENVGDNGEIPFGFDLDSSEAETKEEYPSEDSSNNDKFSNGMSVNEFFSFLEAAEPLSDNMNGVTNQQAEMPEEDPATKILDKDRERQNKVNKAKNKVHAKLQPAIRAKRWLSRTIESLIKRDENQVKREILENHDYRHSLHKAARFAIKSGAIAIAFTINGYIGSAVLVSSIAKEIDKKERLAKEVQEEFAAEIEIINDKIELAERNHDNKTKWKLMRLKSKMENMMAKNGTYTGRIKTSKQVAF